MRKNQKKFILSFQVNDLNGSIKYTVDPLPISEKCQNSIHELEFDCNVNQVNTIKLQIIERTGTDAYIQIKNMKYNNINITDLNLVSFLKTDCGEIRRTHGYVDSKGEFVIKLHTNPVSLNYLNYLLSLTKSK